MLCPPLLCVCTLCRQRAVCSVRHCCVCTLHRQRAICSVRHCCVSVRHCCVSVLYTDRGQFSLSAIVVSVLHTDRGQSVRLYSLQTEGSLLCPPLLCVCTLYRQRAVGSVRHCCVCTLYRQRAVCVSVLYTDRGQSVCLYCIRTEGSLLCPPTAQGSKYVSPGGVLPLLGLKGVIFPQGHDHLHQSIAGNWFKQIFIPDKLKIQ